MRAVSRWRDALAGWRLLTGSTGFIGRYLLWDALQRRENVAVLVRHRRGTNAAERIDQIITEWERRVGTTVPRPVVLAGDLGSEGLGLSSDEIEWFRKNVSAVVHSAASVCFQETSRGEPMNSNVHGTSRLLDLCRHSAVTEFHYVSTAYSCGDVDRLRPVLEELHSENGPFGNIYEASKCQAEHLVRSAPGSFSRTIFRPSIVIGESKSGYSSSFNTIYTPLRLAWMLYKETNESPPTERELLAELGLAGDEARNIVTVDWVCDMIGALTRDPSCHGKVYHLTNPHPTPGRDVIQAIGRALSGVAESPSQPNPSETKLSVGLADFSTHMDAYRSYFVSDPVFDNSRFRAQKAAVPCPIVDVDMLTRTFQYAVSQQFKVESGQALPIEKLEPRSQFENRMLRDASTPRLTEPTLRIVNVNHGDDDQEPETPMGPAASQSTSLVRITLTGSGGGAWQVRNVPHGIQVEYPTLCDEAAPHFYGTVSAFRAWLMSDSPIEEGLRSGAFVLLGTSAQLPDAVRLMTVVRDKLFADENPGSKPDDLKVEIAKQPQNNLPLGNAAC